MQRQRKSSVRTASNTQKRKAGTKQGKRVASTTKKPKQSVQQITFRPRRPDDDAYIIHLTEEQLGTIHEQSFQEPFPREQFLRYLQSGAPTFIVERGDKRIGYFSYLIGHEGTMHISAMVIEPQYQSDGIGTAVMKQLETDAISQGVQVLEVFVQSNNQKSLAFTRKLGFVEAYQVTPTTICFQKRVARQVPSQAPTVASNPVNPYAGW